MQAGSIILACALALWAIYGSLYALAVRLRYPHLGTYVRVKGGRLAVTVAGGEGAPVLFLHGASANSREWRALAAQLGDGLRPVLMDRPGHGHSTRTPRAHTLAGQAAAVAEGVEKLGLGPVLVVAHSLGCATALRLALDRADLVSGLVLCAPASHPFPGDVAWHARLAATPVWGFLFSRLVAPLVGPWRAASAIEASFAPAPAPRSYAREAGVALFFRPKTFRANARELVATKKEFAAQYYLYDEVEAACAIVTGDEDAVVSPRLHALALSRAIPKAELIVSPGAGHMPHHTRADLVRAAIRRLARLAPAENAE